MNKFKKKLCVILLSSFIFVSSCISSFANPLVAIPISYELLMGLIAIGCAYGIAQPLTDDDYWGYTDSLRRNMDELSVDGLLDKDYFITLDEYVKQWNQNNNSKPPEQKEPLKIPFIPGLDTLFKRVGEEVSQDRKYVSDSLGRINLVSSNVTASNFYSKLYTFHMTESVSFNWINANDNTTFYDYSYTDNNSGMDYLNLNIHTSNGKTASVNTYMQDWQKTKYDLGFAFNQNPDGSISPILYQLDIENKTVSGSLWYNQLDYPDWYKKYNNNINGNIGSYPKTSYVPATPSVDSDNNINIKELPQLDIPVPTLDYIPSFDVAEPMPDSTPGPTPDPTPTPEPVPGLLDWLSSVIVPPSTYFPDKFNSYANKLNDKMPIGVGKLNDLCVEGTPLPDFKVTIKGVEYVVFKGQFANSLAPGVRTLVAGFTFVFLLLYNYSEIYRLVRGTRPFSTSRGGED